MFHTLVVVGASLAGGCGPKVASDEDAGDGDSSGAASSTSSTSGPGTSVGTVGSSGTSAGTSGVTGVTTTGPDTVTSVGEVGPASDTCPSGDGCQLDVPAPKFDLGALPGAYECCWDKPCADGLVCDQGGLFCTAYCMNPDTDCPSPPSDDAKPVCVDGGAGIPVCMLDCSAGETCPPGLDCTRWENGPQAICNPWCIVPIG
jgi:hypothetical protein